MKKIHTNIWTRRSAGSVLKEGNFQEERLASSCCVKDG